MLRSSHRMFASVLLFISATFVQAADEPLFTVNKPAEFHLQQGAAGDYFIWDLVAFKLPAAGFTQAPTSIPRTPANAWVGGVWGDYSDGSTKLSYIPSNGTMTCGPDVDLVSTGTEFETLEGTGGEGVWSFEGWGFVSLSDGGFWYYDSPHAVLTALKPITINENGVTTFLAPGETYTQGADPMLILEALPPVAIASTTTPAVITGGTVSLDGSASYDQDQNGASIVEWLWKFDNTTAPGSAFQIDGSTGALTHILTVPGEYVITLIVTDNEGQVSQSGSASEVTVKVIQVTFDKSEVTAAIDGTNTINATIIPATGASYVTYNLVDTSIATVDKLTAGGTPDKITVTGTSSPLKKGQKTLPDFMPRFDLADTI